MPDTERVIKSVALTEEQKRLLDGAPILEPDSLDAAIIGTVVTPKGCAALYDYEKLVEAFMRDDPESSREAVVEWISYNTVRALPYLGPRAPWILEQIDPEEEGDELPEDEVEFGFNRYRRHQ